MQRIPSTRRQIRYVTSCLYANTELHLQPPLSSNTPHAGYFPIIPSPSPLVSFNLHPSAKDGTQSVFIAPDTPTLRIAGTDFSQRFEDVSGLTFPDRDSLTLVVELSGGESETIVVPYVADYLGAPFIDSAFCKSFLLPSFLDSLNSRNYSWEVNCVANSTTNFGVDPKPPSSSAQDSPTNPPNASLALPSSTSHPLTL
ncbi:hypothetical protein BDY19DRAFT_996903 [Irpex rosettiformis]|uniref:Uncharacterized protein n=1 Tax=Irpex rosettiformis TaxID=378272 RepID=A0ACB8TTK8_9APHY|nr:hypothetical protein BDY19DRAFT_996903 [Irpex rosettiformis]